MRFQNFSRFTFKNTESKSVVHFVFIFFSKNKWLQWRRNYFFEISGDFTRDTTDEQNSSQKHKIDHYNYFTAFDPSNLTKGFDIAQLFTEEEFIFDQFRQFLPLCMGEVGKRKPDGHQLRTVGLGIVNEENGQEANQLMVNTVLLISLFEKHRKTKTKPKFLYCFSFSWGFVALMNATTVTNVFNKYFNCISSNLCFQSLISDIVSFHLIMARPLLLISLLALPKISRTTNRGCLLRVHVKAQTIVTRWSP